MKIQLWGMRKSYKIALLVAGAVLIVLGVYTLLTKKIVVLKLPSVANGEVIELQAGKEALVDCNIKTLSGTIDKHTIAGLRYTYYTLDTDGSGTSTLAGCPPESDKVRFIHLSEFIDARDGYVLVVVPRGYDARYEIRSSDYRKEPDVIEWLTQ